MSKREDKIEIRLREIPVGSIKRIDVWSQPEPEEIKEVENTPIDEAEKITKLD